MISKSSDYRDVNIYIVNFEAEIIQPLMDGFKANTERYYSPPIVNPGTFFIQTGDPSKPVLQHTAHRELYKQIDEFIEEAESSIKLVKTEIYARDKSGSGEKLISTSLEELGDVSAYPEINIYRYFDTDLGAFFQRRYFGKRDIEALPEIKDKLIQIIEAEAKANYRKNLVERINHLNASLLAPQTPFDSLIS